jgi:hypothetical protein
MAGHVVRMGETCNAYRIFVEKGAGIPSRFNRKVDLREVGCEDGMWVEEAEDPVCGVSGSNLSELNWNLMFLFMHFTTF